MSNPKRQHFVPRFYLERFALDGTVELVDRYDLSRVFPQSVARALAENHFYTRETARGRDYAVEKMFAERVEGPAAAAFKRVFDEGNSLEAPGRRGPISLFLAFQFVRGPGTRRALVEQHEVVADAVTAFATPEAARRAAAERGVKITDENIAELARLEQLRDPDVIAKRSATKHVDMLLEQALALVPFIEGRNWSVLQFASPLLLTSDEPVALVGPDVYEPGDAHGVRDSAQLVFPIDPRQALMMTRPDMPLLPSRMSTEADAAVIVNRHVAFNAHRHIVRRPGTDPLAGLTLPTKAPAAFSVENLVAFQPNVSEGRRAKTIATMERRLRDDETKRRR